MAQRVTVTLHELVSALDGYAEDVLQARHAVSFPHFAFLVALAEEQPIDITHLARCLGVTKAAVSKRVPAMVEGGWVQTSVDAANARRVVLSLTDKGATLVREAGGELEALFADVFADPRLAAMGVDVPSLNRQLALLTTLIVAKGTPS
ncbi:MarR family winged helix-turn-helix transcriptional regulator [Microbacterium lacus]|uniref:MarR family winged helix-turn-helix transcriptional regulator n=1 Tax=Microbacterium lacus TaxID=415217 RepID=UPI00384CEA23